MALRPGTRETSAVYRGGPKGNPDDNPVETIFSDVQQMVLETSSDTEPAVTQRRISGHLQGCNRRPNRRIRVSYSEIPPNHR